MQQRINIAIGVIVVGIGAWLVTEVLVATVFARCALPIIELVRAVGVLTLGVAVACVVPYSRAFDPGKVHIPTWLAVMLAVAFAVPVWQQKAFPSLSPLWAKALIFIVKWVAGLSAITYVSALAKFEPLTRALWHVGGFLGPGIAAFECPGKADVPQPAPWAIVNGLAIAFAFVVVSGLLNSWGTVWDPQSLRKSDTQGSAPVLGRRDAHADPFRLLPWQGGYAYPTAGDTAGK